MDRGLLRRAPDAEWVPMYRLGLSRRRIAALVRAEPAAVGYHLAIARRQVLGLEAAHQAAAGSARPTSPSPGDRARMDEVIAWITAGGRFPVARATDRDERSMARWLSARRREAADGTLDPAYRDGLVQVPGWRENRREAEEVARYHERLAQLGAYRQEGNDWPRHQGADSEREHTLGAWIHVQRYQRHRSKLDPDKVKLLDNTVPSWQTGRTRGRPPLGNRSTPVERAGLRFVRRPRPVRSNPSRFRAAKRGRGVLQGFLPPNRGRAGLAEGLSVL